MVPIMFTLPAVLCKGETPQGSKLKHLIALCFKCELSVENSRPVFFLSTQRKSPWSLQSSTNHPNLNTFQLLYILATNIFASSQTGLDTWLQFYHLPIEGNDWESSLELADEHLLRESVKFIGKLRAGGKRETREWTIS